MTGNLALTWEILEIVWINILLSGDNAILGLMLTSTRPSMPNRKLNQVPLPADAKMGPRTPRRTAPEPQNNSDIAISALRR
jgi:hypothetical protein